MKSKLILLSGVIILALGATSCSKHCWCYEPDGLGQMREDEAWVDETTPCKTLSYGNRTCVEDGERMDPNQIANPLRRK